MSGKGGGLRSEGPFRLWSGAAELIAGAWSSPAPRERFPASRYFISAIMAGVIAFVLIVAWLDHRIRESLLKEVARSSSWFVEDHLQTVLQELRTRNNLSDAAKNRLTEFVSASMLGRRLIDIKIWSLDRRILFSSHAAEIGTIPPSTRELDEALAGNIASELDDQIDGESSPQRTGGKQILEVYFPVYALDTKRIIAVAELYLDGAELIEELWSTRWQGGLIAGLVNTLFFSIVFGVALRGKNIITWQKREIDQKGKTQTKLLAQNSQLVQRVIDAQQRNVELTDQILRHVGSDLHDGPAQLLSVALLRLGEVATTDGSGTRLKQGDLERVIAARVMTQDALAEVRNIAKGLILPHLEDLHVADVIKMAVADHKKRTQTDVRLQLSLQGRDFSLPVKKCIFRCIQEGLNNAYRHAGGREQFVGVIADDAKVVLTIKDSGPGLTRSPDVRQRETLGIAGLRNRVEVLGGQFTIDSTSGTGTTIIVELPLVGST